ncbi:membrane protein [Cutibacterium acnes JCM 18909]|nr:membrane protein [Cutibacterium acnes JCM 18909]
MAGSCLNGGTALAAPLIGAIMDANGWQWGFLVAGIAGAVIGATVWTAERVVRKRQAV